LITARFCCIMISIGSVNKVTVWHIFGIMISLLSIVIMSIYSGKAAKSKKGANSCLVAGAIMGTLIGGSSTVGTAQLAYSYGMSAWWFTLGSGIACLILAFVYAKPFYKSGHRTLISFITEEYGLKSSIAASVLSSVGSFINIISQLIAATAIIAVVFPKLPIAPSVLISAVFMIIYIIFGGTKGSGIVGILKTLLLYVSMIVSGVMVLKFAGGFAGFLNMVDGIDNTENVRFFSLFARGVGTDLGACLSLILGVITTQSYAQAIFMADKSKDAVKGALFSALLVPIVGIGGILVGLYMRAVHPGIVSKTALTLFVTEYMPPVLGGIVLGALFIAVVGTGSGLALGIATVIKCDILPLFSDKWYKKLSDTSVERLLLILVLISAGLITMGPLGDTILNFAFMSMGLRGATIFLPLCCSIWLKGKVRAEFALWSIVLSPIAVLIFGLWGALPFDPLFVGVFTSCVIMIIGYFAKR